MGRKPTEIIAGILGGRQIATLPTGWGSMTIEVWDTPSGQRIIGMPHPSWYMLFGREDGNSSVAEASFRAAAGRDRA